MRKILAYVVVAIVLGVWSTNSVAAATLSEIIIGIGYDNTPSGGRILQPATTVTNLDWPVSVLVRIRDVTNGASVSGERLGPDGQSLWSSTLRWSGNFSLGWGSFFIPLPGTPNEERLGQWKIVVRMGNDTKEAALTVVQAERSVLETLKAEIQKSPDSFTVNYRLGAAASMFGDDILATTHLKKAAQLARTSVYPHLALCRHFLKRNMKTEAQGECAFARGLLMGVQEQGLAGWLQQVIEEYMKQAQ